LEYYLILGTVALIIGLIGFIPYFIDTLRKRTKPHAFSWFIWSMLLSIGFFAQISKGAGAGAWLAGAQGAICFLVFVIALFVGEKEVTPLDKASLIVALFGIALWVVMNNPLYSVIIVSIVDAVGFVPTFRKSYKKPREETIKLYALSGTGFLISLFALQAVNLTTILYPSSLVLTNFSFVAMVMIRRRALRK
jgi:uncharacterized protein with PQ loop repeat